MAIPGDIAIAPARLAEALTTAGGSPVSQEDIEGDIARGAPAAAGQIPLLAYVGWLLKHFES